MPNAINPLPAPTAPPVNITVPQGTFGSQYSFPALFGEGISDALAGYFKGQQQEQKTATEQAQKQEEVDTQRAAQQARAGYEQQDITLRGQELAQRTASEQANLAQRQADAKALADYRTSQTDLENRRLAQAEAQGKLAAERQMFELYAHNPDMMSWLQATPEGQAFSKTHFPDIAIPPAPQIGRSTLTLGQVWGDRVPSMFRGYTMPQLAQQLGFTGANGVQEALKWASGQWGITAHQAAQLMQEDQRLQLGWFNASTNRGRLGVEQARETREAAAAVPGNGPTANHVWTVQQEVNRWRTAVKGDEAAIQADRQLITSGKDPKTGMTLDAQSLQAAKIRLTQEESQYTRDNAALKAAQQHLSELHGAYTPTTTPVKPTPPPQSSNGAPAGKVASYKGHLWKPDGKGGWVLVQ